MFRLVTRENYRTTSHVARSYSLEDVCLTDLKATRSVPFASLHSRELRFATKDNGSASFDDEGKTLVVTVRFNVTVTDPSDDVIDDLQDYLAVSGAFELRYLRILDDSNVAPEDAQVFARINGVYNAWPYMREIISSCFARVGYPPLTLESLVFAPKSEAETEDSGNTNS